MKSVYTIYDSKAEAYMTPFFVDKDGQALRDFQDVVQNPETPFAKHPEDYTLFKIGTYDPNTAQLKPLETPVSMGLAIEFTNNSPEIGQ